MKAAHPFAALTQPQGNVVPAEVLLEIADEREARMPGVIAASQLLHDLQQGGRGGGVPFRAARFLEDVPERHIGCSQL